MSCDFPISFSCFYFFPLNQAFSIFLQIKAYSVTPHISGVPFFFFFTTVPSLSQQRNLCRGRIPLSSARLCRLCVPPCCDGAPCPHCRDIKHYVATWKTSCSGTLCCDIKYTLSRHNFRQLCRDIKIFCNDKKTLGLDQTLSRHKILCRDTSPGNSITT